MEYINYLFMLLPITFIAYYVYYEFTASKVKRKTKGEFTLLYGGGFLSKQSYLFQIVMMACLVLNLIVIILYFSGLSFFVSSSFPPFVGVSITGFIMYGLIMKYVQIGNEGVLFGNVLIDWTNIEDIYINGNKRVDSNLSYPYVVGIKTRQAESKCITVLLPERKLEEVKKYIELNFSNPN
jgi:hypothetical protein